MDTRITTQIGYVSQDNLWDDIIYITNQKPRVRVTILLEAVVLPTTTIPNYFSHPHKINKIIASSEDFVTEIFAKQFFKDISIWSG